MGIFSDPLCGAFSSSILLVVLMVKSLICPRQFIAPSVRGLGIDMTSVLGIARARGFDEASVSALLQAAEVGLIKAMNEKS